MKYAAAERTPFLRFALVASILLAGAAAVIAADATTATLTGTVTISEDGTPLPGVAIAATDGERGTASRSVTDVNGRFRIPGLRPAVYTVTAELDGFAPYTISGIVVEVGREIIADMALKPGFEEEINVEATYQAVDPTQTQVVTNIRTRQIESLPLPTRNYLELAFLAPGVSPSRDVGFDASAPAQSDSTRYWLAMTPAWLLILTVLPVIFTLRRYSIDRERQHEIRRLIEERRPAPPAG